MEKEKAMQLLMLKMYSEWLELSSVQIAQASKMVDFCSKNITTVVKRLEEQE